MIRRISKNNDLLDVIKSCPSGVIDDIYLVKYYIDGSPDIEIEPDNVTKVGNHLEVILPISLLQVLPNGILKRRAFYKVVDEDYPDGYYDLEFDDDLNIWLGGDDVDPYLKEYLTADDLKTINFQSIVGEGNIEIEIPSDYATKSWVSEQGYITSDSLSGYATESWVESQGYLTSETIPSDIATQSWVTSQGYYAPASSETVLCTIQPTDLNPIVSTPLIVGTYAEGDFVDGVEIGAGGLVVMRHYYQESQMSQDYAYEVLTESTISWYLNGYATESWVSSNYVSTTTLSDYTTFSDINSYILSFWQRAAEEFYSDYVPRREIGSYLSGYATEAWVSSNFLSTTALTGYATQSWVTSQGYITSDALSGYATESWVESQGYLTSVILSGYATESWVQAQGYLTSTGISGLATISWVESQGYLTSVPSEYATQSWVTSQGYITSNYLNGYATQSWVSSQNFATQSWVTSQGYLKSVPSTYATQAWVTSQGYLTSVPAGYATEVWVTSQGYLSSVPSEYATQSWVSSQNFATQNWVTTQNYLEESKIWTGNQSAWDALTPAQQAYYTIALVTE